MPTIDETTYSQEACVASIPDFYQFLVRMYLPESAFIEPLSQGWPSITIENMRVSLLRHLSYLQRDGDDRYDAQEAPWCYFADGNAAANSLTSGSSSGESLRVCSEEIEYLDEMVAHVIGLTLGGRSNPTRMLDTIIGGVHWSDCLGETKHDPSNMTIEDDPYAWPPRMRQSGERKIQLGYQRFLRAT